MFKRYRKKGSTKKWFKSTYRKRRAGKPGKVFKKKVLRVIKQVGEKKLAGQLCTVNPTIASTNLSTGTLIPSTSTGTGMFTMFPDTIQGTTSQNERVGAKIRALMIKTQFKIYFTGMPENTTISGESFWLHRIEPTMGQTQTMKGNFLAFLYPSGSFNAAAATCLARPKPDLDYENLGFKITKSWMIKAPCLWVNGGSGVAQQLPHAGARIINDRYKCGKMGLPMRYEKDSDVQCINHNCQYVAFNDTSYGVQLQRVNIMKFVDD